MTPGFCPHCGAEQPETSDAFCAECREALDEPPAVPHPPEAPGAAERRREAGKNVFRWLWEM
ncbi:MAG: hypothetical protein K2W96_04250, partial [Gemmataceae bacterium]|nr:hypothetical protein [Gemmataceae bacterium]